MDQYGLRLYDEELLPFSMEDGGLAGMQTRLLSVHSGRQAVFPLDLELTEEGMIKWLESV